MKVVPEIEICFPYRISIIILDFQCNVSDEGPLDPNARLAWENVMEELQDRIPASERWRICWATTTADTHSLFVLYREYLTDHLSFSKEHCEDEKTIDVFQSPP